jgi:hypothetical protein
MQVTGTVERLEGLSPRDFVERYEPADQPFVIAGGALDWPAVAKWSPEYLTKLIGSVALTDERFLLRRRDGETTIDPELAPLYRDVELPPYVPRTHLDTVSAWFSGPGVRTRLRYDNNGCHDLNAQITGEKECLLFAPAEIDRLYPFSPDGPNPAHHCSAVDVEAPDLVKFPAFAGARAVRAELVAGDLLFIPVWWSHTFRHRGEFNSSVNFWWKPEHPRDNAVSRREEMLAARTER